MKEASLAVWFQLYNIWKGQKKRDSKKIRGFLGEGLTEVTSEAQGICNVLKLFGMTLWSFKDSYIKLSICQNPKNFTGQRVNFNVCKCKQII